MRKILNKNSTNLQENFLIVSFLTFSEFSIKITKKRENYMTASCFLLFDGFLFCLKINFCVAANRFATT